MSAVDLAAMRQINSRVVLQTLFQSREPVKMSELVRQVQLSRRTTELILDQLVEDRWVVEVSAEPGLTLGRPPRTYQFNAARAAFVAIAIDTHTASVAIIDASGTVHRRDQCEIADMHDPLETTRAAAELAASAIKECGIPATDIFAATLSVTGRVDDDGTILHIPYRPSWTGFDPRDLIEDAIGLRPTIDNDANLAALGEQWLGSAQDQPTFVWLIAGVRLGAGLVINKQIHRGYHGAAGQIMQVGSMGLHAMENLPLGRISSPIPTERMEADAIIRDAVAGDVDAQAEVREFLDLVEPILSTFAWTLAPTAFILGGGMESTGLLIVELQQRLTQAGIPPVEVRGSALGADAVLFGAARLARDLDPDAMVAALREQHLMK